MSGPPASSNGGRARRDDDDWGPATSVYSASAQRAAEQPQRRLPPVAPAPLRPPARERRPGDTRVAFPPETRGVREPVRTPPRRADVNGRLPDLQVRDARPTRPERGLPGWGALLLLVAIAAAGGLIDTATNTQVRGAFNIGVVVASGIAILAVRRSDMLPVVLAPPIVYSGAAMFMLYVRSGGFHNKHEVINAALNYLVYGFPAIATATGVVLVIAAIRMLAQR